MIEFWNTNLGRKLIDGTLPGLVHVLERIAKALEESNDMCRVAAPSDGPQEIVYGERLIPLKDLDQLHPDHGEVIRGFFEAISQKNVKVGMERDQYADKNRLKIHISWPRW